VAAKLSTLDVKNNGVADGDLKNSNQRVKNRAWRRRHRAVAASVITVWLMAAEASRETMKYPGDGELK